MRRSPGHVIHLSHPFSPINVDDFQLQELFEASSARARFATAFTAMRLLADDQRGVQPPELGG